jgi:nucleotide-binding universal stress UspA family protein
VSELEATEVREIVVPLDGTRFAESAIPPAGHLATRLDAGVCLFSAVPTVDDVPEREASLAGMKVARRPVDRPVYRPADREVVVNLDPAGAIHETLRRRPGAIACMASRARVRGAALTRSVLTELLARGHDPVIAVGPLYGDVAPWKEHEPPTGVVVGVDDVPHANALVDIAQRWASLLHEPLTVVTVAEPVPPAIAAGPVHRRFGPDGDVDLFLRVLLARVRDDDHAIEARALYDPVGPPRGMLAYTREHPSSLVVVGTHARTGLARFARGSRAAAIVRGCPSPVLVVPVGARQSLSRAGERAARVGTPAR